ncbi:hypothetical protein [uncultured Roseovarius sp.]|nr:hypothetical protein [uncultured Roseovarius sp.]
MKAMYAAFAVTAIITVGAYYGLNQAGFSAEQVFSGDAVRIGDANE